MIGFLLTLSLSLTCPQDHAVVQGPHGSSGDVTMVVTTRDWQGSLPMTQLELGSGGIGKPVVDAGRLRDGQALTPGGVLVRAQPEGVKLDFPSRRDLLIDKQGRVHLRSGHATKPSSLGVHLLLADGSRVCIVPSPGGNKPMRLVQVYDSTGTRTLWRYTKKMRARSARRRFLGESYLVLGDGDVLYRFVQLGPILVLERALCPPQKRKVYPPRQVVIMGNVLGASLQMLPRLLPKSCDDFPRAHAIALALASQASKLFPFAVQRRPRSAAGLQVIGLANEFRLQLEVRGKGPVVIGLYHPSQMPPLAEWTVTTTTRLHLVKPDGGRGGGPRYVMRGIELKSMIGEFVPVFRAPGDLSRARRILREMGAEDNATDVAMKRG